MKRNTLKMARIGVFLIMASILTACAPRGEATPELKATPARQQPATRQAWEEQWDKALLGARNEGSLMVYGSLQAEAIKELSQAMKDRFGIQLEFVSLPQPAEILARVQAERRAGIYGPDIFLFGATSLLSLFKPQGILDPIEPLLILPEVTDPKGWFSGKGPFVDNDRKVIGFILYATRYVLRNTDMVREGEIKSYRDLVKPQFKGKIVMYDPTTTGSGNSWVSHLVALWGLEEAQGYLREFVKLEPAITRDKHLQVEWVARGKYPIAIATDGEKTVAFLKTGAPIQLVYVTEGTTLSTGAGCLGLPPNRPHPNAATVFVNWLLSKEGQNVFVKAFGLPSRRAEQPPGVDLPKHAFTQPGEKFIIDDEEQVLAKGKLLGMSREIFATLLK